MSQTATTSQIARLLCRDERTIQRLTVQGVLSKARDADGTPKRRTYEVIPTVQSFIRCLDDQLGLAALNDSDFRAERTGLVRAQRQRAELENQLFKGQLHRADDVEAIMNDILSGIKMRLLAIPSRIARVLVGQTAIARIIDIITSAIELALGDLLTYRAEDFYARNRAYLEAAGIDRVEALTSESSPEANGETTTGDGSSD
jgi:phage terminase Nu1 subunit (DNA packaging protein)